MNTITETQLVDNARNGAVEYIKAVKSPEKPAGFNLFVKLSWKEGDLLLITQQKKPRVWVNTQRLLTHIQTHYREVKSLTFFLRGSDDDESS